jgi:hypothetical protein
MVEAIEDEGRGEEMGFVGTLGIVTERTVVIQRSCRIR